MNFLRKYGPAKRTSSNTCNKANIIGTIIVVAAVFVIHIEINIVVKQTANNNLKKYLMAS